LNTNFIANNSSIIGKVSTQNLDAERYVDDISFRCGYIKFKQILIQFGSSNSSPGEGSTRMSLYFSTSFTSTILFSTGNIESTTYDRPYPVDPTDTDNSYVLPITVTATLTQVFINTMKKFEDINEYRVQRRFLVIGI